MSSEIEHACRICGAIFPGDPTWENSVPNYVICNCCGLESGIGDTDLESVRSYRGYWVGNGAKWSTPTRKPDHWDLLKQLENIPPQWR
ncbi:hypothetical protein ACIQ7D_22550 [Streptomyces sp. NPDC096310]|uniref:hypothetical protein n=1 Tax=Streptomyces sp. NPDC096310 TaxID=3366082 RepID=UPI00382639CF